MFNVSAARSRDGRYLLLLGADPLLRERAVVSALRTYPGPVVGMAESTVVNANRFFDHVLRSSAYNAPDALAAVLAFERETGLRPDAVVPILEMNVHVAVAIAEHYGLPSLSPECLARVRDKHTMKVAFEDAGVPCARHRLFSDLEQLRAAARELTFPLVLKPRDFAGSVGTIRVDRPEELPEAFEHCRRSLLELAPIYGFADGRFQAEEFVTSTHEISVEVINYEGQRAVLAVTDKAKGEAPYFVETGQLIPSRETDNAPVRALALKACEALLIDRGIAHVEILMNGPDEMNVVEVAARPGGDGIMDLIDRVYGFNPYDLHIAAYRRTVEQLPAIPAEPRGIGAIAFLKAEAGTLSEIKDIPEFTDEELALYILSRVGDRSQPASSYLHRNGILECFQAGADGAGPESFQKSVAQLAQDRGRELFAVRGDSL
jgi:biotin carboxylase